jgi:hypothetical protein
MTFLDGGQRGTTNRSEALRNKGLTFVGWQGSGLPLLTIEFARSNAKNAVFERKRAVFCGRREQKEKAL